MAHLCPWWLTYTFDNQLRRLVHNPKKILAAHLRPGMRVADIGCGMGYFTTALAELVGPEGKVLAVDLQAQQLARARQRVIRQGFAGRLETIQARKDSLGISPPLDFVLAFWMVHEVRDAERFFGEIADCLVPRGQVLVAEPWFHVSRKSFMRNLATAAGQGLIRREPDPHIRLSYSAILTIPRWAASAKVIS